MMHRIQTTFYLMLIFSMLIPFWASAQSITASFDPTESVKMAAAASWRDTEGIGFIYRESTGNRTMDDVETHRFDTSGTATNLHLKFGNVSFEGGMEQYSTDITVEELRNIPMVLDEKESSINLALLGNDFVSVGLRTHDSKRHEFEDETNDNLEMSESIIAGSISVKTFDFLYLGAGFEKVVGKSDDRVDNTWNNVIMGASAILGEVGSTRLRLEYSFLNSPEAISDSQGTLKKSVHFETQLTSYSAELMLNGLLFVGRGTDFKMYFEEPKSDNDEKEYEFVTASTSEAGVLWIPESGVSLGFFYATSKMKAMFEDENSEFRINLAYIFE